MKKVKLSETKSLYPHQWFSRLGGYPLQHQAPVSMSGGISGCHNWGGGCHSWQQVVEPRDAARNILQCPE